MGGLTAALLPFAELGGIVALAFGAHVLISRLIRRLKLKPGGFAARAFERTRWPRALAVIAAALLFALTVVALPGGAEDDVRQVVGSLFIVILGWTAVLLTQNVADLVMGGLKLDVEDNLRARQSVTQVRILSRTVQTVIVLLTISLVLLSFESVRQWGVSLLASAGVAGLVVGLAARPLFANLIAGVQIALTQPIRIEDVVIVEDEWGWIEEITSTFVVIRLWDWRRMIVPLSRFIEAPFQNWTRQTASIIGQVTWHLDYAMPVDPMRARLTELVRDTPLWDGKVVNLQVVEAFERTIVVRALVSARNSPIAWDLRCEIREKMLAWLQQTYPQHLPKVRADISEAGRRQPRAAGASDPDTNLR